MKLTLAIVVWLVVAAVKVGALVLIPVVLVADGEWPPHGGQWLGWIAAFGLWGFLAFWASRGLVRRIARRRARPS